MRFKLSPFITGFYKLPALKARPDGKRENVYYVFDAGVEYDTEDFIKDTPNIVSLLDGRKHGIPYTRANLDALKSSGAEYSTKGCKSCGGAITQINVKVFVEVE
ncbi:MAG: hypothetical protein ACK5LJ_08140 [Paracoccus sp. (in: a-proteobacteria)]